MQQWKSGPWNCSDIKKLKSFEDITLSLSIVCHLWLKKEKQRWPFDNWLQNSLKVSRVCVSASWDKVFQFLCTFPVCLTLCLLCCQAFPMQLRYKFPALSFCNLISTDKGWWGFRTLTKLAALISRPVALATELLILYSIHSKGKGFESLPLFSFIAEMKSVCSPSSLFSLAPLVEGCGIWSVFGLQSVFVFTSIAEKAFLLRTL